MTRMRSIYKLILAPTIAATLSLGTVGCKSTTPEYGTEQVLRLPSLRKQVWAVAPAVNLSGQRDVDALLQADILYQHLQEVRGLTVIPVNRVVEVYAGLRIDEMQSPEQAAAICELLGCDALVIPTVTAFDPYDPPKFGASIQMFRKPGTYARPAAMDVSNLARAAAPTDIEPLPPPNAGGFLQAVGMFDAANGSIREALWGYAKGRHDPVGPMGKREYLQHMDRFVGFGYHTLIVDLLRAVEVADRPPPARRGGS